MPVSNKSIIGAGTFISAPLDLTVTTSYSALDEATTLYTFIYSAQVRCDLIMAHY